MGIFKRKGNPAPKCVHCNGTGRVKAPWVANRNVKPPPQGKKIAKRIRCYSCGGTGYG